MVLAVVLLGANPAQAKYASIVVDAETGLVLHETNADTRNYPASLTKMMTLYLLFEALQNGELSLSDKLSVSARAAKQQPSKLGLKTGSTISVENAIRGLVTKSANDVAVVVAEAIGDTEWGFAKLMTAKAKALGMSRTNFYNASGLPDSRQLSTARDMATLSLALIENFPQYYHYFSLGSFTYKGKTYSNHNKLLTAYNGVDGIKTGYTKASGYNIAVSAVKDGRRVIAVVFGGKTASVRNRHTADLLDQAFVTVEELDLPEAPAVAVSAVEATVPPEKPVAAVSLPLALAEQGSGEGETVAVVAPPLPASPIEATPLPDNSQVAALGTVANDATPQGVWAIQVGAFSRFANAEKAAVAAGGQAAKPLAGASIQVVEVRNDQGLLYRARLANLSEGNAREACRLLTKQNVACLVIQPGS
ncbi:MAG TPA: D-alanyl-D-alanine carboxypeptidase family protein [Kiloniellales bacterium]|nr:D-alanyl-D-alanine carboxypeptidase family protein [Kiloniellales bacterium]